MIAVITVVWRVASVIVRGITAVVATAPRIIVTITVVRIISAITVVRIVSTIIASPVRVTPAEA
jgi:hypothetical protein